MILRAPASCEIKTNFVQQSPLDTWASHIHMHSFIYNSKLTRLTLVSQPTDMHYTLHTQMHWQNDGNNAENDDDF